MSGVFSPDPTVVPPIQLRPTIRVGSSVASVDVAGRLLACYRAFTPGRDPQITANDVPAGEKLLTLDRQADVLTHVRRDLVAQVRVRSTHLMSLLAPYLIAPLGHVDYTEVTFLTSDQQGFGDGTVVLVRHSDLVAEQYVLPHLQFSPANGAATIVGLPGPQRPVAHPPATIRMAAQSGVGVTREILGAVMSVTPFLPPPWSYGTTGVLSLATLILGWVDPGQPPPSGPSPLEVLRDAIETFIVEQNLAKLQGDVTQVSNDFLNDAKSQSTPLEQLKTVDGGISDLRKRIVTEFVPHLDTALGEIYVDLKARTTVDYKSSLDLMVSAVTLAMMLHNAMVTIDSVSASVAKSNDDVSGFNDGTSKWLADVNDATNDLGTSSAGPWDDTAIQAGLTSTSHIPNIEAWMAKVKADRLAQISEPSRYTLHYTLMDETGWTWTDAGLGGDGGHYSNRVWDTAGGTCDTQVIQHEDQAQSARDAHYAAVGKSVDDGFADYRTVIDSWTTYITDFHELLPPASPDDAPTVAAKAKGPANPQGDWVTKAKVRYAVAAVNKQGPASDGPWSAEYVVGPTAFATLTLTSVKVTDDTDTLWLYRQVQPSGGKWGDLKRVAVIGVPLPPTFDDVATGEDNW